MRDAAGRVCGLVGRERRRARVPRAVDRDALRRELERAVAHERNAQRRIADRLRNREHRVRAAAVRGQRLLAHRARAFEIDERVAGRARERGGDAHLLADAVARLVRRDLHLGTAPPAVAE